MFNLYERLRHGATRPAAGRRAARVAGLAAGAMLSLGLLVPAVSAQPATPAGEVVDPAECRVEPLTDELLTRLAGTPESVASPEVDVAGSPAPFSEPEGEPASEAEVEAVTTTMREIVACLNAGDYRRAYALYTENYLLRSFAGQSANLSRATPEPNAAVTQIALVGVTDVIRLEDGRVGARIELTSGEEALRVVLYSVFAQVGDRWLVDEETALDASEQGGTPAAGTPTN